MTDIVPALLDSVQKSFKSRVERDGRILRVNGRIRDGTATLADAHVYSQRVGTALSNALREHITADTLPNGELYYNIADRVINPTLMENYELVNETAEDIQRIIDTKDGIGLGSVKAPFPQERVDGLIDKMTTLQTGSSGSVSRSSTIRRLSLMTTSKRMRHFVTASD